MSTRSACPAHVTGVVRFAGHCRCTENGLSRRACHTRHAQCAQLILVILEANIEPPAANSGCDISSGCHDKLKVVLVPLFIHAVSPVPVPMHLNPKELMTFSLASKVPSEQSASLLLSYINISLICLGMHLRGDFKYFAAASPGKALSKKLLNYEPRFARKIVLLPRPALRQPPQSRPRSRMYI
jgi:hypothetical protein